MVSLHITGSAVPHPAVGMVGRSETRHAMSGDLRVSSDSPTWKIHYFSRGIFHWQFGHEEVRLEPGSWLVIPPGAKHGGVGDIRECGSFYRFHFLTDHGPWPGLDEGEMTRLTAYLRPGVYRGGNHTALWQRLFDELQGSHVFRSGRCALLVAQLLHGCLDDLWSQDSFHNDSTQVDRVCAWIEGHLDEPLTTNTLARLTGLSRTRFTQRFREATGSAPAAYIHERRMERACDMLKDGEHSILEEALGTGFSSSQAFATTFKRSFGVTPTQWRKDI